jgi:hypothetical protein
MDRATDKDNDMDRDKYIDVEIDPTQIYVDGFDTLRKFVPSGMILCRNFERGMRGLFREV